MPARTRGAIATGVALALTLNGCFTLRSYEHFYREHEDPDAPRVVEKGPDGSEHTRPGPTVGGSAEELAVFWSLLPFTVALDAVTGPPLLLVAGIAFAVDPHPMRDLP